MLIIFDYHTHFMEQAFNIPYPSMECKCTTMKEIEHIIKSLKTKNSCGYDEISTKILKISCPFISSPVNYICNKMLIWGVFPDRLKYTIIKPLHKNDNRCEVSNYRPVSLFNIILKNISNGNANKDFKTPHQIYYTLNNMWAR